jgi:hypothetical protein
MLFLTFLLLGQTDVSCISETGQVHILCDIFVTLNALMTMHRNAVCSESRCALKLWGAAKSTVYCDHPRTLNKLRMAITAFVKNISQADLQKVFVNKIKWVQACIDTRGHHFQFLF